MKMLVFGYQAVGHECLRRLITQSTSGAEIVVVTHRDRSHERLWFPSVAELARQHGIEPYYSEDYDRSQLIALARRVAPDLIYSFYFRELLPQRVLDCAPLGAFNMHGSLLPRYRGRCPANWVILNREPSTGMTLHHMVRRPDAGDIVGQLDIPVAPRETAFSLYDKLVPAAGELIDTFHPRIVAGDAPRIPQDERLASYFGGRRPEDGRIDWGLSAPAIDALVRAVTHPFPGAFSLAASRNLYVWQSEPRQSASLTAAPGLVLGVRGRALRVACRDGALDLLKVSWAPDGEVRAGADVFGELPRGSLLGSSLITSR
ncbi:MAG: formyltransferase [Planctomycetota bacterium]